MEAYKGELPVKQTGRKGRKFTKNIDDKLVITGNIVDGDTKKTYSERNVDVSGVSFTGDVERKHTTDEYLDEYYRLNDTISSCIDVTAFAAVGGGFHFAPLVEGQEINPNHRVMLHRFFNEINPDDESEDLLTETFMDLGSAGDCYWERVVSFKKLEPFLRYLKNPRGDPWEVSIPYQFYKVSGFNTKPQVGKDGKTIIGYIQKNSAGKVTAEWTREQIIHFRYPSPINEVRGVAPSATLGNTIAADIYASDYNGKFFENNATPRLHIDLGNVSKEELDAFIGKAKTELKGQPHKNLVTRGGVKVSPVGITNSDMEFSLYQKSLMQKILAKYRVPPSILGYGDIRNASESESSIALFKFLAVEPMRRIVASRINKRIIRPLFPFVKAKFAWNPVDALDLATRSKVDSTDLDKGIRSVNEIRAERGMSAVPWGSKPVPMPGQKIPGQKDGKTKPDKKGDNKDE